MLRMVSLKRSKAGFWTARKGLPADVRDEHQRLYGQGHEVLFRAPLASSHAEAKALCSEWLAEVENRIASIRKRAKGEGISLTHKEALGLAGEWYRWFIAKHQTAAESDREAELGWWFERISFLDDLEELAPQWFREQAERTEGDWRQWLDDPSVRVKARSIVADYGHTAQFLADRGLVLTAHARDLFLDWRRISRCCG